MRLTEAIVLKKIPMGETDGLYVLYTKEAGKIRAYAKGVCKEEAKLRSHLEPLTHAVVGLVEGKYGPRIVYAAVDKTRGRITRSLEKMHVAWYVAKLVDAHCMEGDYDKELWGAISNIFDDLEILPDTVVAVEGLLDCFEKEFTVQLGYGDDVSMVRMVRPYLLG